MNHLQQIWWLIPMLHERNSERNQIWANSKTYTWKEAEPQRPQLWMTSSVVGQLTLLIYVTLIICNTTLLTVRTCGWVEPFQMVPGTITSFQFNNLNTESKTHGWIVFRIKSNTHLILSSLSSLPNQHRGWTDQEWHNAVTSLWLCVLKPQSFVSPALQFFSVANKRLPILQILFLNS